MGAETLIAVGAIVIGILLAVFVASRMSAEESRSLGREDPAQNKEGLAAGILREIALLGGASLEASTEIAQARTGWDSLPPDRVDITGWGTAYAEAADEKARLDLLDGAVVVAMSTGRRFPPTQYSGLVALSFSLGFHTDALARLRERYGFEYDDWARFGRPRSADREGGGAPLFDGTTKVPRAELLAVLGLDEKTATRQMIVSAYRHLAAESHPDRFHDASEEERHEAAKRFRELSAAYQELIQVWDRD